MSSVSPGALAFLAGVAQPAAFSQLPSCARAWIASSGLYWPFLTYCCSDFPDACVLPRPVGPFGLSCWGCRCFSSPGMCYLLSLGEFCLCVVP